MTSKDLSRMKKLQKLTSMWLRWQTTLNLSVHEDDIEELLEVGSEELTNEQLELEQKCTGEEKAREKETTGEEKEEPSRKSTMKCLAKAFKDFTSSLKSVKIWTPTQFSLI